MTVEVKICGLRTSEALDAALDAGADYVGFVFYGRSPRNVELSAAGLLADAARGRAKSVALVVDADDALLTRIVEEVAPDIIQLHGAESPERAGDIRQRFGRPVMKAVSVSGPEDVRGALTYAGKADRILFDAKPQSGETGALPGGNGIAFDWRALAAADASIDYVLAGGLTPENVVEAVQLTGARAVDVSSGVESRPGEKDAGLIRRFISAAKTAKQTA